MKSKRLYATLVSAAGLLAGGLLGVLIGATQTNESVAIACYVVGALSGAFVGAMFARRGNSCDPSEVSTTE